MTPRITAVLVALGLSALAPGQGLITTVAGTDWVFDSNGAPALNTPLGPIPSVSLDASGELIIADPGNAVILRVDRRGRTTILAGNGLRGYSGDGGLALNASLQAPSAAVFDRRGNLLIADTGNNRIRSVAPDGTIRTIAGTGAPAFRGDGGLAPQASLNLPLSIAVDAANNLYINDRGNARIRRVSPDGVITTFAGNGQARYAGEGIPAAQASLDSIEGIALESSGALLLADSGANRIRRIDSAGVIRTIAGDGQARFAGDGGPALQASLYFPIGVAAGSSGSILVSDTNNARVRVINASGVIATIAGTSTQGFSGDGGPAIRAAFLSPNGLVADALGNVFVADRDNMRVRHIGPDGIIATVAGNGGFRFFPAATSGAKAFLTQPLGVSVDPAGAVLIADSNANRIRTMTASGLVNTLAGTGLRGFGDGNGLASAASLAAPTSAVPDGLGNVYIAEPDNHIVRRVSSDGRIVSVAGNGAEGFSGDGGPATAARLSFPQQVAFDRSGNWYISDYGNHRIRRVTAAGVISTFAGNGQARYAGDGEQAAAASLNRPAGMVFDALGNLYFADSGNARVRRIAPSGIITSVAGGGFRVGAAANSFPGVEARLGTPLGVVAAPDGTVYFSDAQTDLVFRLSVSGVLTVVAGNGVAGFSGDGGLSTQAALNLPYGLALDSQGNLLIADAQNDRIRAVLARRPSLTSSPATMTLTAKSGGSISNAQPVSIASTPLSLSFAVVASTTSGGAWLKVSAATGSAPSVIEIYGDPAGLAPGQYQGSVTLTSSAANSAVVAVTFQVGPADPPRIEISPSAVSVQAVPGGAPVSRSVSIGNSGSGVLLLTATATVDSGGDWLRVSLSATEATPLRPATLTITADPARLTAGTYIGSVRVGGSAIPVVLLLAAPAPNILLSHAGITFLAVEGGGPPPSEVVSVFNDGIGELTFDAKASTFRGGPWLRVANGSGRVPRPLVDSAPVNVAVDAAGLSAGEYYGELRFTGPGVRTQKIVTVLLRVLPAGADPGPDVRPASVVFVGSSGSAPSSEEVRVTNLSRRAAGFTSSLVTSDGGKWVSHAPAVASIDTGQTRRIVVQPDFSGFGPGVRRGVLTLVFDDGSVRTVNVLTIVPEQGVAAAKDSTRSAANCPSDELESAFSFLRNGLTVAAGRAVSLDVKVTDKCGNPLVPAAGINTAVNIKFGNGDRTIGLTHRADGEWIGSWTPATASAGQIEVTAVSLFQVGFVANGRLQAGRTSVFVRVENSSAPIVRQGALVHAASQIANLPVAPGTLVTVYGTNLSDETVVASEVPLRTTLSGTQVLLGGEPLPILYSSPGQINAQVPFDLAANKLHEIVIRKGDTASVAEEFSVSAAQPGIFTTNSQGTGQGTVIGPNQRDVADVAAPAQRSQPVIIYCTGLGAVDIPVPVGAPAPSNPLARVKGTVRVEVGGRPASLLFAGLSPGFAGLYQVNAVLDADTPVGDQVPLSISVDGQKSNTVTIAVR